MGSWSTTPDIHTSYRPLFGQDHSASSMVLLIRHLAYAKSFNSAKIPQSHDIYLTTWQVAPASSRSVYSSLFHFSSKCIKISLNMLVNFLADPYS
jgi:hypothetical protein